MTARVLVVEDNPDIQVALGELLGHEGFEVSLADNGRIALDRLEAGDMPSWIVLDLMMPVMDGWEFLRHLDETGTPHPPITVLTALSYDADTRGLEERFGCRVLSKSTDIGQLLLLAQAYREAADAA
ncbi:response regulator [Lysobacter xanthus]